MSESIEKKVRKATEKNNIKPGHELHELNSGQAQLQEIHNAQMNNIREARMQSGAINENNQLMSQVANMVGSGMIGGAAATALNGLNPATQQLLAKYGLGAPKVQTNKQSSVNRTPQNVTVHNTTENVTNNNVNVAQPPAQQVNNDSNTGKFKAWISGVFSRQQEQSARREKEYQKRESALSRASSKMMRRMESLSKTFSERLDPRIVGKSLGNQIKTTLMMLGFGLLASNWKKVLKTLDGISSIFGLQGAEKREQALKSFNDSPFIRGFVGLLGGEPGKETLGQAIKGLGKSIASDIGQVLKDFAIERMNAIKTVESPKIGLQDVTSGAAFSKLGDYLGKILQCLVGGADAVAGINAKESTAAINSGGDNKSSGKHYRGMGSGAANMLKNFIEDNESGYYSREVNAKLKTDENGKEINVRAAHGDQSLMYGRNYLVESDVTKDNILPTAGAGVRQGRLLTRAFTKGGEGTSIAATGFERMMSTAIKQGRITVDENFFNDLAKAGIPIDMKSLLDNNLIKKESYKYIVDKTTEEEKKKLGVDYIYRLVRQDHPTPAVKALNFELFGQKFGRDVENIPHYEISPEGLQNIQAKIGQFLGADGNFSMNTTDLESMLFLDKGLRKKRYDDKDIPESERNYNQGITKNILDGRAESEKLLKDKEDRKLAREADVSRVDKAWDAISNFSLFDSFGGNSKYLREGKKLSESESTDKALQAMDYLISKGFQPHQAAGLVGNFLRESGFDIHVKNNAGGGNGAIGIAQWRGDRQTNFKAFLKQKYGKDVDFSETTLEDQLDFVVHELTTTHKTGGRSIVNSNNVDEAAANALGYYEFSIGPKKVIPYLDGHKNIHGGLGGREIMDKGVTNARDILMTYNARGSKPTDIDNYSSTADSTLLSYVGTNKIDTTSIIPNSTSSPVQSILSEFSSGAMEQKLSSISDNTAITNAKLDEVAKGLLALASSISGTRVTPQQTTKTPPPQKNINPTITPIPGEGTDNNFKS